LEFRKSLEKDKRVKLASGKMAKKRKRADWVEVDSEGEEDEDENETNDTVDNEEDAKHRASFSMKIGPPRKKARQVKNDKGKGKAIEKEPDVGGEAAAAAAAATPRPLPRPVARNRRLDEPSSSRLSPMQEGIAADGIDLAEEDLPQPLPQEVHIKEFVAYFAID
jgi:hypothetical protein